MSYRDDRQALALELAALERENADLREQLKEAQARYDSLNDEQHEARRDGSRTHCVNCGGSLLPVAVFAGHDVSSPLPLKMSTIRFGSPAGGFTAAAPIRSMACSSCGFIHSFIDMDEKVAAFEPEEG